MRLGETTLKMGVQALQTPAIVLALLGIVVFAPLIDGGTTHYPVFLIRYALVTISAAALIKGMKQGTLAIPKDIHMVMALALLALALLSLWWAPYTSGALQWVLSLASYAVFFTLVVGKVVTRQQVRLCVLVLCGMGIGEAILGAAQYGWLGYPRAQGTFFNPNFFATYLVAIGSVALGLLAFSVRSIESRGERWLLAGTVGATALGFLFAQSRGGVLALLCSIGIVGFARFGKRFGVALAALLIMLVIVPNPIRQRAIDVAEHDPYAYSRLDIWTSSLQRVADQPLGAGAGMYRYTSFAYRFPIEQDVARFGKRAESAHNEYLQIAVELGVAGILVVVAAVGVWIGRVRNIWRRPLEPWERGMVIGSAAGTAAILGHAAVDSIFHEPALMLLLVLLGGLILAISGWSEQPPAFLSVPFSYSPMRLVLVLCGAVLTTVLVARPAAAWYWFQAGEEAFRSGRVQDAVAAFQRATMIDPGVTGYHDAVARAQVRAYEQSGDIRRLSEAVDELEIGRSLNRQDARFSTRLGMLQLLLASRSRERSERDRYAALAAESFEQATLLDPYTPSNYFERAKIRLVQGADDEARHLLRQAVTYEPNFLPARALLAELAVRAGDPVRAKAEYESIVAVQSKYAGKQLNAVEREFLDVDANRVGRLLAGSPAS